MENTVSAIWKEYARVLFVKTRKWERDNLGSNGIDYLYNMRKARKAITAAMLISSGYGWYSILFVLDERESFKLEVEQKFKAWNDKQSKVGNKKEIDISPEIYKNVMRHLEELHSGEKIIYDHYGRKGDYFRVYYTANGKAHRTNFYGKGYPYKPH